VAEKIKLGEASAWLVKQTLHNLTAKKIQLKETNANSVIKR
jgi:hypothetical protein